MRIAGLRMASWLFYVVDSVVCRRTAGRTPGSRGMVNAGSRRRERVGGAVSRVGSNGVAIDLSGRCSRA
jgi:hypothetical protein